MITYAVKVFSNLDDKVAGAIIAAVGTVLAAVAATLFAQQRSSLREIAEAHRPKKIEIYSKFMDVVIENQKSAKAGEQISQEEITERYLDFFYEFTKDTLVWSSPKFLKAYQNFKNGSPAGGANVLLLMDDILREIRSDLNISNRGFREEVLSRCSSKIRRNWIENF